MSNCNQSQRGKHFMTLSEGYPIPRAKTGALLEVLYQHSKCNQRNSSDSDSESQDNNETPRYMSTVYEAKVPQTKVLNNILSLIKPSEILIEPYVS